MFPGYLEDVSYYPDLMDSIMQEEQEEEEEEQEEQEQEQKNTNTIKTLDSLDDLHAFNVIFLLHNHWISLLLRLETWSQKYPQFLPWILCFWNAGYFLYMYVMSKRIEPQLAHVSSVSPSPSWLRVYQKNNNYNKEVGEDNDPFDELGAIGKVFFDRQPQRMQCDYWALDENDFRLTFAGNERSTTLVTVYLNTKEKKMRQHFVVKSSSSSSMVANFHGISILNEENNQPNTTKTNTKANTTNTTKTDTKANCCCRRSNVRFLVMEYRHEKMTKSVPLIVPEEDFCVGNELFSQEYVCCLLEHMPLGFFHNVVYPYDGKYTLYFMDDVFRVFTMGCKEYIILEDTAYKVKTIV